MLPLGICVPIEHTSVFPATDDVSASIKASQTIGILLEDWSGDAMNYSSIYDAGSRARAQAELDRMVETGRADRASSWQEVVALVGPEAKLTQLACVEKVKDGKLKARLIVDVRRSGVNGRMNLLERICLPRISDVAVAVHELLKDMHSGEHLEMMVMDFSDAFTRFGWISGKGHGYASKLWMAHISSLNVFALDLHVGPCFAGVLPPQSCPPRPHASSVVSMTPSLWPVARGLNWHGAKPNEGAQSIGSEFDWL